MKKYIFILLSSLILFACKKDDEVLTKMDSKFESYLVERFDLDGDGEISPYEASLVVEIDCSDRDIWRLDGIEDFPNLEVLICANNDILLVNVSKNTKLRTLICDGNSIATINVTNNPLLETLSCKDCGRLDSLVINTSVKYLDIRGHLLDSIDFHQNTHLKELYCGSPYMKVCNVSQSDVELLDCSGSEKLTELNLDGCFSLRSLTCDMEDIVLDLSNSPNIEELYLNSIEKIDISHSQFLKVLHCTNTNLVHTNLDLSKNLLLEEIKLAGISMDRIDLSVNMQLTNVDLFVPISQNSFDLSNHTKLVSFSFRQWGEGEQNIALLNFSGCTSLENLNLEYIKATSINVSGCRSLSTLKCVDSRLTDINLNGCINLSVLDCRENNLTVLELGELTKLTELNCSGNKLTSLKTNSNNLTILNCVSNQIRELNVRNQPRLLSLYCNDNQISTLDLTGCTSLLEIDCRNMTSLTSLILDNCQSLETIFSTNCSLTKLDVSTCGALTHLYCASNRLQPSLDVSHCTKLIEVNCISNPGLTELILHKDHTISPLYKDSRTQIVLVN